MYLKRIFLFEANPAIRSIFCAQQRHKRMPLLSGLKKGTISENHQLFLWFCDIINRNSN